MKGMEGTTLGRYELHRCIAQGSLSQVYLGYDRRVKRRVAVKVLYASNKSYVRRVEHEARTIGTLSHNHILPLYDFGAQHPWYYLVMPFVEGGTLRDYLYKRERLTLEEAGSYLHQIASALQHAHDNGIVHHDVKPSNILLRPDGYAYLADFGLARARRDTSSAGSQIVGTPEYMAPEQTNGQNDHRSDIYSLGIILYQMLTGSLPFTAELPVILSLKHIQTQPTSPRQLNDEITPTIEAVILRALAKSPDERYQHARQFSQAYWQALQQRHLGAEEIETIKISTASVQKAEGAVATTTPPPDFLYTSDMKAPTPLFPLGEHAPSVPSLSSHPWPHRKRPWFLVLTFGLVILSIALPLLLLLTLQRPPAKAPSAHEALQYATATARAQKQDLLAKQARVEATAGLTSRIGAGPLLYSNDLLTTDPAWLNDGRQCFFDQDGYHVATAAHSIAWCYSSRQTFSNVVITAQARLISGDFYGLIFRLQPNSKAFYAVELSNEGEFRLIRAQGSNIANWLTLIDWKHASAIEHDNDKLNTFLIIAQGSHLTLYVNQQLLFSAFTDETYQGGFVGFLVGQESGSGAEAVFRNLWIFQK
ncbi:serine/threonine protein kinase [Thermosporothrix hazakensis]|jgi:serine/threonine protein kinase|uniref:non-specific serine/threonine protein kinase n=2 Tax=Thermosporothrix TaxID=768650 RepID=A0A326U292_THEHA|nr:serine/threonine-protein kinase [Thermosporothrix hazakensis]PZW24827.1 serine/threonine protein kinase [Thermosporothrix hazakensis]BBH88296.1 hypothetical protein KTC_30470 [Thermosporothrix sp. COM3]GCE46483.1 hypothetical protein KTH_13520 [Thermosporothrix hazakensis]